MLQGMREYYSPGLGTSGAIFLFDFKKPFDKPIRLRLEGLKAFTPHGIGVHENEKTGQCETQHLYRKSP